jgi:hypothetical protein
LQAIGADSPAANKYELADEGAPVCSGGTTARLPPAAYATQFRPANRGPAARILLLESVVILLTLAQFPQPVEGMARNKTSPKMSCAKTTPEFVPFPTTCRRFVAAPYFSSQSRPRTPSRQSKRIRKKGLDRNSAKC